MGDIQNSSTLLTDRRHVRRDMQLIGQAIKDERFDIPDELLTRAPQVIADIFDTGNIRERQRAVQLLIAMVNSNKPKVQAHLHQHRGTYGPLTAVTDGGDIEQRRRNNAGRIASLERFGGNG